MVIGKYRITRRGYFVFGSTGILLIVCLVLIAKHFILSEPVDLQTVSDTTSSEVQITPSGSSSPASSAGSSTTEISVVDKNKLLSTATCTVYFKPDDYTLDESFYKQLDAVVEMSQRFKDVKILVDGYFNGYPDFKTTEFWTALAQNRAEMVEAYLISQGVESDRVIVNNKGCENPVNKNGTWQELEKNRRVEVYFETLY